MTTTKKVILISSLVAVAGTATWFFWLRKRGGVSAEDRAKLQALTIQENPNPPSEEDYIVTHPLTSSEVK